MILRPQRFRTLKGFILGLCVSLILLGLGYAYFQSTAHQMTVSEQSAIEQEAVDAYIKEHPTSLIYVAARELKSGNVLSDSDLMPAETSKEALPTDAVTDLSQAMGKVIRCDVVTSTAITQSLLYDQGTYPDDVRLMEYTVVNLPQKLEPRQFVDIRIMFPNGLNYIVLSKKQVTDLLKPTENQQGILWIQTDEEEVLRMSSAIVDASIVEGAMLYAVPYVAPDIQKEAVMTYPSNNEVQELILQDPNIVTKAVTELEARNRRTLEERVNQDRENFGKTPVYDKDATKATPTPTLPAGTDTPSQEEPLPGTAMDGRL